eukprot:scaffold93668_cov52-Phaeocystis_antarctica.AAC.1
MTRAGCYGFIIVEKRYETTGPCTLAISHSTTTRRAALYRPCRPCRPARLGRPCRPSPPAPPGAGWPPGTRGSGCAR